MATELRHGTWARIFLQMDTETKLRARKALTELALVVEKQAKLNASNGSHKYRTRTPASPGEGPAVISGTLRRSITHTPVRVEAGDYVCKVGMAVNVFPSANYYPGGTRTAPSSKYAFYLENGLLKGSTNKYPFLGPAFKFATGVPAVLIYNAAFGSGWRTIG